MEARGQRLQAQGRSVFTDLALPEAAVTLKQGAGRLIRSETDRGILVVCDHRLTRKGYGMRLLSALPPMRRITGAEDFEAALLGLRADLPEELPPGL
jgi:ATP-dependent DNA helicase DinG